MTGAAGDGGVAGSLRPTTPGVKPRSMDIKLAKQVVALLTAGQPFALACTLATRGSSPRRPGAWMVIRDDGSTQGTVGGGPLEARTIEAARQALHSGPPGQSRLLRFVLTEADATGLGMTCGGESLVLVQAMPAGPTTEQVEAATRVFEAVVALLESSTPGWLVTEVSEPTATSPVPLPAGQSLVTVRRAVVDAAGQLTGEPLLSSQAAKDLAESGTLELGPGAEPGRGLYVEPLSTPETAYIFGAGHCGQALAPLLKMIGMRVVVVDDREEFANRERFPEADSIVLPPAFDAALEGLPIDERSYLVIMTRCHAFDRTVLAQALRTAACYVGMIGSQRKVAGIFSSLRDQGFTDADLARVHAPIGLEIGAETPEEIAVSIAAEIVQVRRGLSR